MRNRFPGYIDSILVVLILLTGLIIRFYHFYQIPFTHDEFSALFRTQFNSFKDLIINGVKPDGHPAGIQVFLFYWTRLAGSKEFIVKLPFALAGFASIWVAYRLADRLFGKSSGLFAAAFLATLEYTVMYSQVARPYAPGLLFGLLLVHSWSRFILQPDKKKFLHLTGYVVFGALCMYTHYFSFLLVVLVGITGLFFLKGKKLRNYLAANLILILLFLPHLKLTFFDLHTGGVGGWLGLPERNFLMDYIEYAFQYSILNLILVSLFLLAGGYTLWRKGSIGGSYSDDPVSIQKKKFALIFILWFVAAYLIGFFYSKWVQPVLQYSVLIFFFPFLLMAVFSGFPVRRSFYRILLVLFILIFNTSLLVFQRKYFDLFYHSSYREIVREYSEVSQHPPEADFVFLSDIPAKIKSYYEKEFPDNSPGHFIDAGQFAGKRSFIKWLDSLDTQTLYYGTIHTLPAELYPIITDRFPVLSQVKNYFLGNFYHFSKTGKESLNNILFDSQNDFSQPLDNWHENFENVHYDTCSQFMHHTYHLDSPEEFGPTFTIPANALPMQYGDVIDVSAKILPEKNIKEALLVLSVESGQKVLWWNAANIFEFETTGTPFTVYLSKRIPKTLRKKKNLLVKFYIWNRGPETINIQQMRFRIRKGNPVLYGLYEKL